MINHGREVVHPHEIAGILFSRILSLRKTVR